MFLSREIDIKLYKIYTKTYKCKMLYEIRSIKQIKFNKYTINLKMTISQRSLRNSGLILLLFEFNNFSFLIDIINEIIYAPWTCHQNSNQWQFSIIVTCPFCVTWRPIYWTSIGESSCHVIRPNILHRYVFVQIWHSFILSSRDWNIRYVLSVSITPEIFIFPFIFPLQSP